MDFHADGGDVTAAKYKPEATFLFPGKHPCLSTQVSGVDGRIRSQYPDSATLEACLESTLSLDSPCAARKGRVNWVGMGLFLSGQGFDLA